MSEMSYLEKLLDGVEVEWKTLGSIAELKRGTSITKKDVIDGTIPVVAGGRTPAYYHNTSNRDGQTIVIAGSGAYAGFVSWWEEPIFVSDAFTVKPHNILLPRYCYHFLMNMQQQLHDFKSGGGVPHVYPRDVSPILIPIPCPDNPEKSLAIQSEIVRVLDKFTALTAELTAELTMRKKQYNYYRDQLLSFDEGEVEWKALGEVGHIVTGRTPKSSDKSAWGDDVDFVTPSDIKNGMRNITCPSRRLSAEGAASMPKVRIPRGSLLVTCIGADMGKTVINANDCIPNQQINAITLSDDSVQVGYLFHILTAMRETLRRQGELGGGTMPLINKSDFSKIVVPIPSHEEQNRIAKILDKFDTLTNSISEGLPREIELRQKQYEYYRDLLFSFPKPDSVTN
ncbi:TPA: restriction endonuclease subunit S [Salmonella enterica]|nr:restriction endonuclease subunit S [Salmonella enterica]